MDILRVIVADRDVTVLVAVETWLDASHRDSEVHIEGYNLLRLDRSEDPNRGGVAVYTRIGIQVTKIQTRPHPEGCKCENVWLKIKLGPCKTIILGAIYRGHINRTFIDHIRTDIECVVAMKHPIFILGDFNYDLLSGSSEAVSYSLMFETFLLEQLITVPTRITEHSATLLDHVWTSSEELVEECEVLTGISDHHMCSIRLCFPSKRIAEAPFSARTYKHFDKELFLRDLQQLDSSFIERDSDVNRIWSTWHGNFTAVLDRHAPKMTFSRKKNVGPWMTAELKRLIRLKMSAKIEKSNMTNVHTITKFKAIKAHVRKASAAAKRDYFRNKVVANKLNPRKLWNIIKEAAPSSFKDKTNQPVIESDADLFNAFFVNVGASTLDAADSLGESEINQPLEDSSLVEATLDTLELQIVSEEQVLSVLKRFPVNKAPGHDGISGKSLNCALPVILNPITRLINKIITMQDVPRDFKKAVVTPIHKGGEANEPVNYRPISVLPLLSKLMERVIADQLDMHLRKHGMLTEVQHGFRKYHSTATCLLQLTEEIRSKLDRRMATGLIALDLSKAFDCIDHSILLSKLTAFGMVSSTSSYKFFKNYLEERTQVVRLNGTLSTDLAIRNGVPQGSILGPILFILYINDLPTSIEHSNSVIYADDTTIYASSSVPTNIQFALNQDMINVCRWFKKNKLKLNVEKTKFMVVHPNKMEEKFANINVFIQGKHIARERNVKILGVQIDENLGWHKHLHTMVKNLRYQYRSFARSVKYFDMDTRKILYNSTLASRFNYADCIWSQCTIRDANMLQSVQNLAVRKMINAGPLESARPILQELEMLTLRNKRKLRSLVLLYKLRNDEGPEPLARQLREYCNEERGMATRSSSEDNYFIPCYNTDYRGKSFFIRNLKLWNSLPADVKSSGSCAVFKSKVYGLLLEEEACT